MSTVLPFVVAGAVVGVLYGLTAAGLVLTYKISGIFNFAHGAVGAASAFAFHELRDLHGLPAPLAAVLSVLVLAPLLGVALSLVARRLQSASTRDRVVATVGILLVLQGLIQLRHGAFAIPFDSPFPTTTTDIGGTLVGADQLITVVLCIVAVTALTLLLRRTRLGLQMQAITDNPELLDLTGASPARVRTLAWVLGASFAGLSGVLLAAAVQLEALLLTLLVVQALGAAALGRFASLPAAFGGGVAIGVVQFLMRAPAVGDLLPLLGTSGLDQSLPTIVLFVVLLVVGRRLGSPGPTAPPPTPSMQLPAPLRRALLLGGVGVAVALPLLAPTRAPVLIQAAVFITIFASLHLLVEVSGQVSLAHTAFVAIGATTFSHVTAGAGLPWGVGVIAAVVAAVPAGVLVAVPAVRVSGLFLALATLGFGILVEQMLYTRPVMFGEFGQRFGARPALAGLDSDLGYFLLCLGAAAAAMWLVTSLRGGRLGRLLRALAADPVVLAMHGATPTVTRVLVFSIAAAMAAVAGALLVGVVGSVSSEGVTPVALVSFNSLLWVAVLATTGRHPIASPVLAALALVVAPSLFSAESVTQVSVVGVGAAALLAAVDQGAASRWVDARVRAGARRTGRTTAGRRRALTLGGRGG